MQQQLIIDTKIAQEVSKVKDYAIKKIKSDEGLSNIYRNIKHSDKEVYSHCHRVCDYAVALGILYNFSMDILEDIAIGSLLHDAGKVLLNTDILYKNARFNADEKLLVEAHTNLGYKLLKDMPVNNIVLDIIKGHHEKLNGKGYPDGLTARDLSIYVQIVTVADIYDALTSDRCYHKAINKEDSMEILQKDDGLNQTIVDLLTKIT